MTGLGLNPIRAATMGVADLEAAIGRFGSYFDYYQVEAGTVSTRLAEILGAPGLVGAAQAVLRPASQRKTDLRLIQASPQSGPAIMASIGWTALEICVDDVHRAHARFATGPFEVIGPPSAIAGLPTIHPMQIEGPDGETIFLTQILTDDPAAGLPVVQAPVDTLFIVVLACRDLAATAAWVERQLAAQVAPPVEIPYRTLSRAFGLPPDHRHTIATASRDGTIFLELDQYPAAAAARGRSALGLTRGVAMVTLLHPDLDSVPGPWHIAPGLCDGAIYEGRRAGVLATPEGMLIELVEGTA